MSESTPKPTLRERTLTELRAMLPEGTTVYSVRRRLPRAHTFFIFDGELPVYLAPALTNLGYSRITVDGYYATRVESFLSPSAVVDQISYDLYGRTGALKHREI